MLAGKIENLRSFSFCWRLAIPATNRKPPFLQNQMKEGNMNGFLEQLIQIFHGSVWDGDLISKKDRDYLVKSGLVKKCTGGWNIITPKGITYLSDLGLIVSGTIPPKSAKVFERESDDVVLIDGRHYRAMSDEETADFVWGTSGLTKHSAQADKSES